MVQAVVIVHVASTWFMVGLIWFVQIVHYPLYGRIGSDAFPDYQKRHRVLANRFMPLPMCLEAVSALLLFWYRPATVSSNLVVLGAGLLLIIWVSTFALQIPRHVRLEFGYDEQTHLGLVRTNWIRTIAWTARGLLALQFLALAQS